MVTYYNKKDLIAFGNYVLSEERRNNFIVDQFIEDEKTSVPVDERAKSVTDADIENWLEDQKPKNQNSKFVPIDVNEEKAASILEDALDGCWLKGKLDLVINKEEEAITTISDTTKSESRYSRVDVVFTLVPASIKGIATYPYRINLNGEIRNINGSEFSVNFTNITPEYLNDCIREIENENFGIVKLKKIIQN